MNQILAKSAQGVQNVLEKKGLTCRVVELSASTRTAQEAATAIGCDVSQIVKSLIFKTRMSQKPILVLTSGPNRVNEKQIESLVGEAVIKADADFTREITGFAIGGIPPVGHKQSIEWIFIDENLLIFEDVWAAAGTPNAVFCLKGEDLVEMTHGKIISIQK